MQSAALKLFKRFLALTTVVAVTLFAVRAYQLSTRVAARGLAHLCAARIERERAGTADWQPILRRKIKYSSPLRANVTGKFAGGTGPLQSLFRRQPRLPGTFFTRLESIIHSRAFRSARGAVVLLHGLTDSPYSLRHVASRYRDHGFVVVAIRLPAHGTVPAALTDVDWETWFAATRLAVREARRRAPPPAPLHIVGFSNGARSH